MNAPEVENPCSIVSNRYTGEVLRARKKLEEMPENSVHESPCNGLHAFCAFVIHDLKRIDFFEHLSHLPSEHAESHNLFTIDLAAMSRVKQTKLSFSCEKKNMQGWETRGLQCKMAQILRMRKYIGVMQLMQWRSKISFF